MASEFQEDAETRRSNADYVSCVTAEEVAALVIDNG